MNEPLVSICCLTYNHESYIQQCLEGFLMQRTSFPVEVLIHDDASTDRTADIIRGYETKYPDLIKPIYQTENQFSKGIGVTMVYQFPRAKGKYIAICEGDDFWTDPYKLQKQVDFLEANPEYGLVYSDVNIIDSLGNYYTNPFHQTQKSRYCSGEIFYELFIRNFINTCTVCMRKEIIINIYNTSSQEIKKSIYDYWIWLHIAVNWKIRFIREKLATYRVHENGISRSTDFLGNRISVVKMDVFRRLHREKKIQSATSSDIQKLIPVICSLFLSKKLTLFQKILLFNMVICHFDLTTNLLKFTIQKTLHRLLKKVQLHE